MGGSEDKFFCGHGPGCTRVAEGEEPYRIAWREQVRCEKKITAIRARTTGVILQEVCGFYVRQASTKYQQLSLTTTGAVLYCCRFLHAAVPS